MLISLLDTTIYILFADVYHFNNLPSGFIKDKNHISKVIEYYEDGNKKSNNDIMKEIKTANYELLKWAKDLPSRN